MPANTSPTSTSPRYCRDHHLRGVFEQVIEILWSGFIDPWFPCTMPHWTLNFWGGTYIFKYTYPLSRVWLELISVSGSRRSNYQYQNLPNVLEVSNFAKMIPPSKFSSSLSPIFWGGHLNKETLHKNFIHFSPRQSSSSFIWWQLQPLQLRTADLEWFFANSYKAPSIRGQSTLSSRKITGGKVMLGGSKDPTKRMEWLVDICV